MVGVASTTHYTIHEYFPHENPSVNHHLWMFNLKTTTTISNIIIIMHKHCYSWTLNLSGRARSSLTFKERPMRVAMLQWGIVGVK